MSWELGFDMQWKRDVGYGVPAYCDHPGCEKEIDRGLAYVCGSEPFGGDKGCGLFFCDEHLFFTVYRGRLRGPARCARCVAGEQPFDPKPDHPDWIHHKQTDPSWAKWRAEQKEGESDAK